MNRFLHQLMLAAVAMAALAPAAHGQDPEAGPSAEKTAPRKVVVIPVREAIMKPELYVIRRGLKDAISAGADMVVLDMETPGGRLDVTFDILKALEKFPGETVTFVNREATSAGALISAGTDQIWLHPMATIGSAEPVTSTGEDINESMQRKILSYLKAKMRAMTEGQGYRGQVISAMMDPSVELVIDGQVLCAKDELLNLTATEACRSYGDPPQPLLGAGTAESIEDMLNELHGAGNYTLHRVVPSWSEDLAQYLTAITPVLLAFGLLGLFIEFKTPGFGVFGIVGLVLLAIVFMGHHVAGLSGYEPMLLLLLGIVLIGVEIFLLPGTVVPAITGAILIIVSLLWAMLDIWPDQPLDISGDFLVRPLVNITLGVVGAVILFIALLRFLPRGGPWGRMILQTAVAGGPAGVHPLHQQQGSAAESELVGSRGLAATDMFPSGQVTIHGKRYEARLEVGMADAGTPLVVTRVSEFGLIVEPDSSKEVDS